MKTGRADGDGHKNMHLFLIAVSILIDRYQEG
jgi:hypothetical protein